MPNPSRLEGPRPGLPIPTAAKHPIGLYARLRASDDAGQAIQAGLPQGIRYCPRPQVAVGWGGSWGISKMRILGFVALGVALAGYAPAPHH
jgi:hypothetical protein